VPCRGGTGCVGAPENPGARVRGISIYLDEKQKNEGRARSGWGELKKDLSRRKGPPNPAVASGFKGRL